MIIYAHFNMNRYCIFKYLDRALANDNSVTYANVRISIVHDIKEEEIQNIFLLRLIYRKESILI